MPGIALPNVTDRQRFAANVAALSSLSVRDGDLITLAGYYSAGDGGGQILQYDSDSSVTPDGGFVFPGIGGVLSFTGTTFDGTNGTGRFVAVDQGAANLRQFGCV